MGSPPTPMCVRILPKPLFTLPHFCTAFEKAYGGDFWPIILDFYIFSKTTTPNRRFWFQWIEQVVESSPELAATPILVFYTKS